ncbi:hypothetical protein C8R48DRAFT_696668 [Suillus tomentosus]|nr:hypothetical protein C8R48DRAFT_696668 [Suillus tomentosus]
MQISTTSPSAAMYSTNNDRVASQNHTTHKTPTCTYTIHCGRSECPAVFVYDDGTDWPTVNCLVDDHYLVCTGRFHGLSPSRPPTDTQGSQYAPSLTQLTPGSWSVHNGNRDDFIIGSSSKRRQTEDERKEDLENDEYTDDVQPTSVRCRGCSKIICLDKRSRYYPGLWIKHRGKCRGILKLENDKLTSRRDWFRSSHPEWRPPAASSIDASGESSEEDEDEVTGFNMRLSMACWEREAR